MNFAGDTIPALTVSYLKVELLGRRVSTSLSSEETDRWVSNGGMPPDPPTSSVLRAPVPRLDLVFKFGHFSGCLSAHPSPWF